MVAGSTAGPDDRGQSHGCGNSADTVTEGRVSYIAAMMVEKDVLDVTKWWSEYVGCDAQDVLDDLFRPSKFGNDLLVGLRRQWGVRPRVDSDLGRSEYRDTGNGRETDLVAAHVLSTEIVGSRDDPGSDNEKCSLEALLVEVLHETRGIRGWAIVETADNA